MSNYRKNILSGLVANYIHSVSHVHSDDMSDLDVFVAQRDLIINIDLDIHLIKSHMIQIESDNYV